MTTTTRRPSTGAAPSTDWMQHGLCRQTDPNLFFPEGRGAAITVQTENAKKVCNQCPVLSRCLDWALDTGQYTGVWGGLSEVERRGLVRGGETSFLRCLEDQEYIEQRLAKGVARRQVALELGVSYEMLRRAVKYFESEREQQAEAPEEVAAV